MAVKGQPKGAPFPGPRMRTRAPQSGVGGMSPGNRPWPGITEPDCYECSWAYRGRWPFGRMEIKYLNAMCRQRAHRHAAVSPE